MNKVAFISDIHGNLPALNAVLSDIDTQGVQSIFCIGDLVGYYSQINEVIDTIKSRNITCCIGNHDFALCFNKGVIPRSRTCTNVLTSQLSYIRKDNLDYLASLPDQLDIVIDSNRIMCVHGGISDHIDEYPDLTNLSYFDKIKDNYSIMISGHNHKATIIKSCDFTYGNCGSVGQPRDHNSHASYIIYHNGNLHIRRVRYDIDETKRQMRLRNFPDYISDVLYEGKRIGE